MHVKISGEKIEALPLKNLICISCLQREQDIGKLKTWQKCIHCQNQICESCYISLIQENVNFCPSYFNGYKGNVLSVTQFFSAQGDSTTSTPIRSNPMNKKKDVIFKFGEN